MTNLNLKIKDQPQPEENLGSFYMGRMKPSATPPRRVLPKGMLTFVMIFAFAAIIWYAYPRGQERYSDIDIPVIAADKAVYKFKPDDPGGMEVLHQDSTVFDPLEKKTVDNVEKLRPTPEEPIVKPAAAKTAPIDKTPHNLDLQAVSHGTEKIISAPEEKPVVKAEEPKTEVAKPAPVKAEAAKTEAPKAEPPKTAASKPAPDKLASATSNAGTKSGPAKLDTSKIETETLSSPVAAKPETAKPGPVKTAAAPVKALAKPASAAGGVYVQFGAYRDAKGAKEQWSLIEKKYPQLLKGLTMHTEVAIGPKGELTRLQAGRVAEARAKEICDAIRKDGKFGCMLVR